MAGRNAFDMVEATVDGERISMSIDTVVNMAYTGRDQAEVQAHVDELLEDDIIPEEPDQIPDTYQVASYTLLTNPGTVEVVGNDTSGEAEVAIFVTGSDIYVTAASDHTDRALESHSIQLAKQITPNVVAAEVWRLDDIRDRWDQIQIRAWNTVSGKRKQYQDSTLGSLLKPEDILDKVRERHEDHLAGTAVMSGTVPTIGSELTPGERFEVELGDPVRERTLSLEYTVSPI